MTTLSLPSLWFSFETFESVYQTTRRRNPEDYKMQLFCHYYLRSYDLSYRNWGAYWWLVVVIRVYDFATPLPHLSPLCDLDVSLPAFHREQIRITAGGEDPYESRLDRETDESRIAKVTARRKLRTLYWKHS